jgi:hypothetical protein
MSLFSAAFLSVYSEKQGSNNLAFLLSSVPFLLLTALYFLCYGLLNLDAQGADVRDIFDDFRLTLPACATSHWWGNATADQLPPPEVASGYSDAQPLARLQAASDGLGDPRSFFISGNRLAMHVPRTRHAHTSFAGSVRATSSSSATVSWTPAGGWVTPSQRLSLFVAVTAPLASLATAARSQRFSRAVSRLTSSGLKDFAVADIDVPLVSIRAGVSRRSCDLRGATSFCARCRGSAADCARSG